MKRDVLFLKKLLEITTEKEIQRIINLTDSEDLSPMEAQDIELFFIKMGIHFGSLYDSVIQICENFDCDISLLLAKTKLLDKLSAEKKGMDRMGEFFV
jgi:hypothetical protein